MLIFGIYFYLLKILNIYIFFKIFIASFIKYKILIFRHCKYPLYCCTECDISFNSIDQFDSHCILTHSSDCFTLKSNLDKYAAELSQKCQALFYGQGDSDIQNYGILKFINYYF